MAHPYRSLIMFGVSLVVSAQKPAVVAARPCVDLLGPRVYSSPSGEFALEVQPGAGRGAGPALYVMTRSGAEVWSGQQPFTPWEAGVTDHGVAAGYAYSNGEGGSIGDPGDFRVVIFAPDGHLRLNAATQREYRESLAIGCLGCCDVPVPLANGMLVHDDIDRFVVRGDDGARNARADYWWIYRLSTGEALRPFAPVRLMGGLTDDADAIDAWVVPGTPLTLVYLWFRTRSADGARIVLLDPSWKPLWTLDRPSEFTFPADEAAWWRFFEAGIGHGTHARVGSDRHFALRALAQEAWVTYAVTPVPDFGDGWQVDEVGRSATPPWPVDVRGATPDQNRAGQRP